MEPGDNNSDKDSGWLPFPLLFVEPEPVDYNSSHSLDLMEKVAQVSGKMRPDGVRDKILIINSVGVRDVQTEELVAELASRGAPVYFFNTCTLLRKSHFSICLGDLDCKPGVLELPCGVLALEEVRSVWFRGPDFALGDSLAQPGMGAEFANRETKAALFGLFGTLEGAFWVNRPGAVYAAEDKLVQLKVAQSLGMLIPRTLVTSDPQHVRDFYESCRGEVILKTFRRLAFSRGDQEYVILTNRLSREQLDEIERVRLAPCLFQEYVPKDIEVRVTLIGNRVFAAEIHSQLSPLSRDDYRRYDFDQTLYRPHALPPAVELACLKMLAHYGLTFGAIDMIRRPDGAYVFLEINANAQFLWIQDLIGLPLRESLADMLIRGSCDE